MSAQLPVQTLVGNLTADPELRYTQSGIPVTNFTIAYTPREFDRQSNEWKDGEAVFFRVSIWRDEAENVAASFHKGDRVAAIAKPKPNKYKTKEGSEVTTTEWTADEVFASTAFATVVITKKARSNGGQAPAQSAPAAPAAAPAAPEAAPVAPAAAPVAAPAPAPAAAPVATSSFDDDDFS